MCFIQFCFYWQLRMAFYVSNRLFQDKCFLPWWKSCIIRVQGWIKVEIYDTSLINQMRTQDMVQAYMASLWIAPPVWNIFILREEQKYKLKKNHLNWVDLHCKPNTDAGKKLWAQFECFLNRCWHSKRVKVPFSVCC